jgi:hypothetical protein
LKDFGTALSVEERMAAKVPDFVSRLKGFLNVLGPNPQREAPGGDPFFVVRRAIVLRSLLLRHAPYLFHGEGKHKQLKIDLGVLRAFLQTRVYRHGVRSMEAIIGMSTLWGRGIFERSCLPPAAQLELHVDRRDFAALVQQMVLAGSLLENLAQAAHEVFCEGKKRDKWMWGPVKSEEKRTHPLLIAFADLPEWAKDANRNNVRTIPQKLAAAGYVMTPARSNETPIEFPGPDLEKLARLEHELWMEAKINEGFTRGRPTKEDPRKNEYLVPWEEVPPDIKQIDRDLIRGIPKVLAKAGYAIVKLDVE